MRWLFLMFVILGCRTVLRKLRGKNAYKTVNGKGDCRTCVAGSSPMTQNSLYECCLRMCVILFERCA